MKPGRMVFVNVLPQEVFSPTPPRESFGPAFRLRISCSPLKSLPPSWGMRLGSIGRSIDVLVPLWICILYSFFTSCTVYFSWYFPLDNVWFGRKIGFQWWESCYFYYVSIRICIRICWCICVWQIYWSDLRIFIHTRKILREGTFQIKVVRPV